MIEISEKGKEEKGTSKGRQSNQRFWEKTLDYFKDMNLRLYQNVTHTEYSTIATGTGIGGCSYICKKGKDEAWVEFHIYNSNWSRKKTEAVFNFLHGYKDLIEEKFGAELRWNQMKGTKRCRIYFSRPVENYEDEEKRQEIIEWFYEHIKKLDIAFKPFSPNLRQFIGTT